MKPFNIYINEKLNINQDYSSYNYQPKDKKELESLLTQLIKERGDDGDFNDIDTSLITDMSELFAWARRFNGDISRWNTSNVTNMSKMFWDAYSFKQDISRWNTSNVTNMYAMFENAEQFNIDISKWNVRRVTEHSAMFNNCSIKDSYKPKFK